MQEKLKKYKIQEGKKHIALKDYPTDAGPGRPKKELKKEILEPNMQELRVLQEKLYAEDKQGLLICLQAMDAAGKDSAIEHVLSGINPQGCVVTPFKQPSIEELDHDYLWRIHKAVPARGMIGIFNRSHYEEVLVARVHDLPEKQPIPQKLVDEEIWERRFEQINNFEKYLAENGIRCIKFFLHLSREEQRDRFLRRIDRPDKNWKFSPSDLAERKLWDQYMAVYEDMLAKTSTKVAPWYIIPADKKWVARYLISEIIIETLQDMNPQYPELSPESKARLAEYRELLLKEEGRNEAENEDEN